MIRPVNAPSKRFLAGLLLLASVFALVRGPLHAATFSLPVSNDDAILLLMARHVLEGELATILWNQPYNGALDAYLLAPGLALGPHHLVFRVYELLCAALLVLLAGLLAAGLRPGRSGFVFLAGLALGASPLAVARAIGASGSTVVTAASAVTAIRPGWLWMSGLSDLAHAIVGLFGLQVPLVVDGP